MKKGIFSLVAVGLMASAASAATIGLQWVDNPSDANHDGPGTVQVILQLYNGDVVAGGNGDFVCATGFDCSNIVIDNFQAGDATGWEASNTGIGSHIGAPDFVGLNGGATFPLSDSVSGPATFIFAQFDVGFEGPADGTQKGFAVNFPGNPGGGIVNQQAQGYTWDTRYNTSYSGYIAFDGGYGNPGFGGMGAEVESPLYITKVPEPTSLALIGLGGLALLRRRR